MSYDDNNIIIYAELLKPTATHFIGRLRGKKSPPEIPGIKKRAITSHAATPPIAMTFIQPYSYSILQTKGKTSDLPYFYIRLFSRATTEGAELIRKKIPLSLLIEGFDESINVSFTRYVLSVLEDALGDLYSKVDTYFDVRDESVSLIAVPKEKEVIYKDEEILEAIKQGFGEAIEKVNKLGEKLDFSVGASRLDAARKISPRLRKTILLRTFTEALIDEYIEEHFYLIRRSGNSVFGKRSLIKSKRPISYGPARELDLELYPAFSREVEISLIDVYSANRYSVSFTPKSSLFFLGPDGEDTYSVVTLKEVEGKDNIKEKILRVLNRYKFSTVDGGTIYRAYNIYSRDEISRIVRLKFRPYGKAFVLKFPQDGELYVLADVKTPIGTIVTRLLPLDAITLKPKIDHIARARLDKKLRSGTERIASVIEIGHEIDSALRSGVSKDKKAYMVEYGPMIYSVPNSAYIASHAMPIHEIVREALRMDPDRAIARLMHMNFDISVKDIDGEGNEFSVADVTMNITKTLKKLKGKKIYKPPRGGKIKIYPVIAYTEVDDAREISEKTRPLLENFRENLEKFLRDSVPEATRSVELEEEPITVSVLSKRSNKISRKLSKALGEIDARLKPSDEDLILFLAIESKSAFARIEEEKTRTSMNYLDYKRLIKYYLLSRPEKISKPVQFVRFYFDGEALREKDGAKEVIAPVEYKYDKFIGFSKLRSILVQIVRKLNGILLGPAENPVYNTVSDMIFLGDSNIASAYEEYKELSIDFSRGDGKIAKSFINTRGIRFILTVSMLNVREELEPEEEEEERKVARSIITRPAYILSAISPTREVFTEVVRSEEEVAPAINRLVGNIVKDLSEKTGEAIEIKRNARGKHKIDTVYVYILDRRLIRRKAGRDIVKEIIEELGKFDLGEPGNYMRILLYAINIESVNRMVETRKTDELYNASLRSDITMGRLLSNNVIMLESSIDISAEKGLPRTRQVEFLRDKEITSYPKVGDVSVDTYYTLIGGYIAILLGRPTLNNVRTYKLPFIMYGRENLKKEINKLYSLSLLIAKAYEELGEEIIKPLGIEELADPKVDLTIKLTEDLARYIPEMRKVV